MYCLYIVIWGSFWLILYSEWYRCRETELFVAVTVRLMDWTLVNNSLYLRWLLYLLCSLYSLIIFSIYVCIHIHYNSVENLHWQKLAETCFCRTGLNRGLNHFRQKPANPVYYISGKITSCSTSDSAYSYTFLRSMVYLSVVCHIHDPCLNRLMDFDASWSVHLWGPVTAAATWQTQQWFRILPNYFGRCLFRHRLTTVVGYHAANRGMLCPCLYPQYLMLPSRSSCMPTCHQWTCRLF